MGQFSISKELVKCTEEQKAVLERRIESITTLQRKNGMEPRDDSLLTWTHVCQEESLSCDAVNVQKTYDTCATVVVKELLAVDYIYKNSDYKALLERTMRTAAANLVHEHGVQWGDAYALCRKYITPMMKLYCLLPSHMQIPAFVE